MSRNYKFAASALAGPTGETVFVGDFSDNFRPNIMDVHSILNITQLIFQDFGGGKDKKAGCGCR